MQILGREVSPALVALHDEVIGLRPEAELKFVQGLPSNSGARGWHLPDSMGGSEVRLAEDFDDAALAHELLHVLIYHRGFPLAMTLGGLGPHSVTARVLSCCVSHLALEAEAADRGLTDLWTPGKEAADWQGENPNDPEESVLGAWRLAQGESSGVGSDVEGLARKLSETMERCRRPAALRWRRAMIDLLTEFDALARRMDASAVLPSRAIMVSLVATEPQLARPTDRMVELIALEQNAIGFRHKQDGGLFHFRFATPGKQRRDLAQMQAELKRTKTEVFLDNYRVPYSVEVKPEQ